MTTVSDRIILKVTKKETGYETYLENRQLHLYEARVLLELILFIV